VRSGWPKANETVQWTVSSDERRSGARPSAPRGRDGSPAQINAAPPSLRSEWGKLF